MLYLRVVVGSSYGEKLGLMFANRLLIQTLVCILLPIDSLVIILVITARRVSVARAKTLSLWSFSMMHCRVQKPLADCTSNKVDLSQRPLLRLDPVSYGMLVAFITVSITIADTIISQIHPWPLLRLCVSGVSVHP